ncbi:MAG: hypothetical protein ACUVWP_05540 [bacterium]
MRIFIFIIVILLLITYIPLFPSTSYDILRDSDDMVINFEPDYVIGLGWCPYEKPIYGITTDKVNLRAEPTLKSQIIATVDR